MGSRGGFTSSRLVELSTTLPEVVLKESDRWTNITFRGRGFAWVNHPENRAMIKAHHDERAALLATAPEVYEAGWATNSSAWVTVHLDLADADEVFELLAEGWRMTATKKAVRAYDESQGLGR
ncbi:MAG: MmcQ/YjbR family DNA-binding protein [Nocardioidaceae bacterium]|nr:MmcQ/YjbR family DNA-binding protein [Nocardioidaceae bacterium]NUS50603.1 MmcQ/YjbR family DNA-binding protein [Nocardioidaceae bacterium]